MKRVKRTKDYAWLAELTGETRGQVWKWATGDTKTFPATFAAKLEEAGVVAARWLLTGEGPEDPSQQGPDHNALRLEVIGRVVDGDISAEAVKLFVQAVAEQDKDADPASSQVEFAKIVREVRWPVAPPEESDESTHTDPPGDPPTDKKSG